MFRLDNLQPSGKKRKRTGRGGSRGGTSGRGHKGQKARSGGNVAVGFEGGQMPLHRRLPKRGFTNARFKKEVSIVNLKKLNDFFSDGDEVTAESLIEKGLIKPKKSEQRKIKNKLLVKVLGDGTITKKLTISAHGFSKQARQAIENAGGKAQLIEEL